MIMGDPVDVASSARGASSLGATLGATRMNNLRMPWTRTDNQERRAQLTGSLNDPGRRHGHLRIRRWHIGFIISASCWYLRQRTNGCIDFFANR